MTGTREPARSSSATASMFPGWKCPAWRCSIPAKGATVASAKDPSPLRYWSRRLHQGIKWRHHPHQVNYNSIATADITLPVLEQKASEDKAYPSSVSLCLGPCLSLTTTFISGMPQFCQRQLWWRCVLNVKQSQRTGNAWNIYVQLITFTRFTQVNEIWPECNSATYTNTNINYRYL